MSAREAALAASEGGTLAASVAHALSVAADPWHTATDADQAALAMCSSAAVVGAGCSWVQGSGAGVQLALVVLTGPGEAGPADTRAGVLGRHHITACPASFTHKRKLNHMFHIWRPSQCSARSSARAGGKTNNSSLLSNYQAYGAATLDTLTHCQLQQAHV